MQFKSYGNIIYKWKGVGIIKVTCIENKTKALNVMGAGE
jgi:hypothetical protein